MDPLTQEKVRLSLWEQIVTGKVDIVKKILANRLFGIDQPLNSIGLKPIHQAILSEKNEMVEIFVDQFNANVEVTDENGRTPLHFAASCGNQQVVEFLISRNANINAQTRGGETPAMKACYFGQDTVLNDLIFKYHCDLTIQNNQGKTLLDMVRTFFGVKKFEMLTQKVINELGWKPQSQHNENIDHGNGGMQEDIPLNTAGLHIFSELPK